jgi:hypothetical protein
MSKTTKNTKRRSTTSGKKIDPKKVFDLANRKVQFFVAITIVALLGGGYYVYRSYAATQNQWNYNLGNGTVQILSTNKTNKVPVKETAKNSKLVAQLAKSEQIGVSVPGTAFPAVPINQPVRLCVISNSASPQLRATQKDQNGRTRYYGEATETTNTTFSLNEIESVGNGYYLACTFKRERSYALAGPITITNTGPQTRISEVIIRFVDGSTTGKIRNW